MLITIIFIILSIVTIIIAFKYLQKNNSKKYMKKDVRNIKNINSLKNIWGIKNIASNVIYASNQYSIILELSSIEYSLMTNEEKNIVDRELIGIAKMFKYPIQFFQVKKDINTDEVINEIQENVKNRNQSIKIYANELCTHLRKIQNQKNLFERKNYMVITTFSEKETSEIELYEFYNLIKRSLGHIKIDARILNDSEIIQLLYEQLNSGSKSNVAEIIAKGGLELYVGKK